MFWCRRHQRAETFPFALPIAATVAGPQPSTGVSRNHRRSANLLLQQAYPAYSLVSSDTNADTGQWSDL